MNRNRNFLLSSVIVLVTAASWWYFSAGSERRIQVNAPEAVTATDTTLTDTATGSETTAFAPVLPMPGTSSAAESQAVKQEAPTTMSTTNTPDTKQGGGRSKTAPTTPLDQSGVAPQVLPPTTPDTSGSGTASTGKVGIMDALVSFGYSVGRPNRAVDTIVVHSSYNALGGDPYDVKKIIQEYREAGVAPHYLVARDGTAYRLVREADVAYHAGVSQMSDGRKNVNDFSIGIEMVGTADSGYTDAQYTVLSALIKDIKTRHTIKYVVGHSDIAPGRKTDPWQLDWSRVKK